MKNIGKPCTGELYARFDEGGLASATTAGLSRHRQTKGADTDRSYLRNRDACSLLYLASAEELLGYGGTRIDKVIGANELFEIETDDE